MSKERIVAAALDLLNDKGMDALTVRALAARLGVQAPALYWHVRNKQELLDEMGTFVMRRVRDALAAIPPDAGWRDSLAGYGRALRAEYLSYRDGARIFSGTRLADADVLRAKETWLARFMAAGFTLADANDAFDVVTAIVVGFVIEEQERVQSDEADPARYSAAERDALLGEGVELVKAVDRLPDDHDTRFERHLGLVLDGLATRLLSPGRATEDCPP
ncbi:transcriptional regulator, TetR family [Lentzea fradiae]|uniref:Transcriptional regulator, TetR family n=2 Tax=Lentzea fradiae TaxID=200378 RepID=A0A1G7UNV2_9PSEU|nr:transcriptional regulator, TetR family [Lentzea fradiae]